MRGVLAWIIAIGALVAFAPSVPDFLQQTRMAFQWGNTELAGGAWLTLGRALAAPLGLFAMAAVVEMLFRISKRLPPHNASEVAAAPSMLRWQSNIAKAFLAVAAIAYVASAWAMYRYFTGAGLEGTALSAGDRIGMEFSMVFYWLTAPLEIIAWAAVIEYLSRIATALRLQREAA